MSLATLIPLVVKTSITLIVFALGLHVSVEDVLSLRERPALLLRSLLSMNVIMPVVAVVLARALDLHPAVKIALVALAISPVPPVLPKKQLKVGGSASYAFGLLVAASLFAIVFVPLALLVIGPVFGVSVQLPLGKLMQIVLLSVLAPLGLGIVVRRAAATFAERIARPLSLVATILLVVAVVPILITAWPAIVSLLGNGTVVAFAAFIFVGLATGHLLGGPDPADRMVLASYTATRHPGVALAIAGASFPDEKLVLPAVLLYMLAGGILSLPYSKWQRHAMAKARPTNPYVG